MPRSDVAAKSYTEVDRERGLHAMAVCGGNKRLAHRELAKQGCHIPADTLGAWKGRHPERYREIQANVLPEIRAQQSEQALTLANQIAEGMGKALDIFNQKVDEEGLTALEAAKATKDLSIPYGIASEKTLMWRGEATQVVEHRLEDDLAALNRLGIKVSVDGEAIEIADAEIVGDAKTQNEKSPALSEAPPVCQSAS